MLMGRMLDSSSVGDGGCWAFVVLVLEGIFNAFGQARIFDSAGGVL